jgi:hypothetical protein
MLAPSSNPQAGGPSHVHFSRLHIQYIHSYRQYLRGCIRKFPAWVDDEIYAYLLYYMLKGNTNGYGGKTH